MILDQLLSTQTQAEAEQGRRLAQVLSTLAEPTYRLEFADHVNQKEPEEEAVCRGA